jgi:hypothetical protein
MHLGDNHHMLLSELCAVTELESSEVRKRMQYWVLKRVVVAKEVDTFDAYGDPDVLYTVDEEQEAHADADKENEDSGGAAFVGDTELGIQSSAAQAKSKLGVIETYVKGILSSQESITLDRLHTMLTMMMSDGSSSTGSSFDMSILDLRRYLQTLIEGDVLECMDGMYRKHPSLKK